MKKIGKFAYSDTSRLPIESDGVTSGNKTSITEISIKEEFKKYKLEEGTKINLTAELEEFQNKRDGLEFRTPIKITNEKDDLEMGFIEDEADELLEEFGINFNIYDRLSKSEKVLFKFVLLRGVKEGRWIVWILSSGGRREHRGIGEADFVIQDKETGICIIIELKHSSNMIFTPDQLLRLRLSKDLNIKATRLIAIIPYQKESTSHATRVFYWSPKFFRSLSKEFFTKIETKRAKRNQQIHKLSDIDQNPYEINLTYTGLGDCLKQNEENCLYQIDGYGEFGDTSTRYKPYSIGQVYEWIYKKLLATIHNPLEEEEKEYESCGIADNFRDISRSLIFEYLKKSYRPLYAEEFFDLFREKHPDRFSIKEKMGDNDKIWKLVFINRTQGSTYVHKRLEKLQQDGQVIILKKKNYQFQCYGLNEYKKFYIPLSKGASKLLDYLREGWMLTGNVEFELVTLARTLGLKGGFISLRER